MTQVIVLPVVNGELPSRAAIDKQHSLMVEGAANADGTWKKGWEPKLLQCFIRKAPHAVYTVVHNVNRNYALSMSLVKPEPGIKLEVLEQTKKDFTFRIIDEKEDFIDWSFRFAMSILIDG